MTSNPLAFRSFDHIWDKVVQSVTTTVLSESDKYFREYCNLQLKSTEKWRGELYNAYQHLRGQLKDICYGASDHRSPEELLDGRKIAAVLCASLIFEKGIQFDTVKAQEFTERKRRELADQHVLFNQWAVGNVYINYKLAYYASLQLVYLTLMRDLLIKAGLKDLGQRELSLEKSQEREEAKKLASQLNRWGHLVSYSQPLRGDGFDVNIIIGLARTDMSMKDLDMFMFAMQLYQIEEHTLDSLKKSIADCRPT